MNTIRTAAASAALALLATSVAPALAAPLASSKSFDGGWSVLIVTEKGTCDRAYRYPVKIDNGTVGYAGTASFNVTGKVGPNGAVTVTVSRGDKSATGTGRMSGTDGAGTWTAASGECSGTWTAERRS
jgi:lipoprotein-anchoring transpeptidase ErfK/SrfK